MADTRTPPFRLNLGRFIVFAFLVFAACFYGIPLLWLLLAGTRSQSSLFAERHHLTRTHNQQHAHHRPRQTALRKRTRPLRHSQHQTPSHTTTP